MRLITYKSITSELLISSLLSMWKEKCYNDIIYAHHLFCIRSVNRSIERANVNALPNKMNFRNVYIYFLIEFNIQSICIYFHRLFNEGRRSPQRS